ncbi:MAG TPA: single-stranded-DNA-specific exonuclease RecJ [Candidatus Krumholzibacteria bacterium]|nr:single-stranded-DNA-specific exonuclease RecJ [Candidatus Krumholzibacteria bacterium]
MNKYRWLVNERGNGAAAGLAATLNIPRAGARLLAARDVADASAARDFLSPPDSSVHDPFFFARMRDAVTLVQAAARDGKTVLVHGDYDADGISGTAILFHYLDGPFATVLRFVPDRRRDGYGVAERAVAWAIDQKVGLFIAVDCGTSDAERLRRVQAAGIPVIVCDHHQMPVEGFDGGVLLNPVCPGETYPFGGLCGAGVAFKLVQALQTSGFAGGVNPSDLLDLVALATVADMAPLTGENRFLVKAGLARINRGMRAGLEAIRGLARLNGSEITARHLSFAFAPRLNAPGRVSRARPSLEILCASARDRAFELAMILEGDNERRRELTQRVHEEAVAAINGMPDRDTRGGFVLVGETWDEGVLGIAAARVVEQFGRPAILMSPSNGLLKGSGRSIAGVNLKEQLDHFHDDLIRYGGHAGAVGLTLEPSKLDRFANAFSDRLRDTVGVERGVPLRIDAVLAIAECDHDLLDFLARCEPFGNANEEPVWMLRDVQITRDTTIVGDGHMKLFFMDADGARGSAISFGWDRPQTPEDLHGRAVDLAVTVRKSSYLGTVYPDLRLVDIRESGA